MLNQKQICPDKPKRHVSNCAYSPWPPAEYAVPWLPLPVHLLFALNGAAGCKGTNVNGRICKVNEAPGCAKGTLCLSIQNNWRLLSAAVVERAEKPEKQHWEINAQQHQKRMILKNPNTCLPVHKPTSSCSPHVAFCAVANSRSAPPGVSVTFAWWRGG